MRPSAGRRSRSDRDAALAFLLHPVGHGIAVMDVTHLMDQAGIEENALGERGLAGVDVRGDADVARALERELTIRRIRILRLLAFSFQRRRCHNRYQRKCANARFACAIL